jgi:hypothetical protein
MVGYKIWGREKGEKKWGPFSRPFFLPLFSFHPFFLTRHLFKTPQNLQNKVPATQAILIYMWI